MIMHKKGSKSLCYISLFFGCWNICRWQSSWATNQQKFDSTNHNLSFYDYELKIIAEMAKTNSIVLPFASKAALSATPIKGQNTKQTKTKIETFIFINMQLLFSLSWQGVLPRHLHIYTASDLQKLIVNKLARFKLKRCIHITQNSFI